MKIKTAKFVGCALYILLTYGFVYSQDKCKPEDKERAKSITQKFEADNSLRRAIEAGHFGDCVHYAWMDEMRKFGIKQVSATLNFVWNQKTEKIEITDISFLQNYDRNEARLKDNKLLNQIKKSGLTARLEKAILESAEKSIIRIIKNLKSENREAFGEKDPTKGKISGTIYVNLLDDEVLPSLVDMPSIEY